MSSSITQSSIIAHTFACRQTCKQTRRRRIFAIECKEAAVETLSLPQPFHLHTREMFAYRHHIPEGADELSPRALRHRLFCSGVGPRRDSRQRGFFMLHACWREINKVLLTLIATYFHLPPRPTAPSDLRQQPRPPPSSTQVELVARRPAAWWRPHKGSPDSRPVTSDTTSLASTPL